MRFLAVPALALMALTTTAHAQTALTPKTLAVLAVPLSTSRPAAPRAAPRSSLPPAMYDKPFTGHLIEEYAKSPEELRTICNNNYRALACTRAYLNPDGLPHSCTITYAPAWRLEQVAKVLSFEAIRRHEIGHCHGWKHSEPSPLFHPRPGQHPTTKAA